MESRTALEIEDLSVRYGSREVIRGLSLPPLGAGTVTALVGPNAAGKTSLLRGLAGLVAATGSVRHGGSELLWLNPAERAQIVGYMPQALPQRVALNVFEAMLSALHATPLNDGDRHRARERALATLQGLGIGDLAGRGLDELSGGQRQLASLGQALVREPAVLLLDEPTSALDLAHQYRVMSHVRSVAASRGIVAVVVLHDLALACRWCDRIVVLSNGDVAADGRPEEAVTPEMLESVYHVHGRIERCSKSFLQVIVDEALAG